MGQVRRRSVGQVYDRLARLEVVDLRRSGRADISLESEGLVVTIAPSKGGDITSVVEKRWGHELLFKTGWGGQKGNSAWDSRSQWLSCYSGGWQVLCPNAGRERMVRGARWGFHGEASVVPWEVREQGNDIVELEVSLFTAPLKLSRKVRVYRSVVRVEEIISNTSPLTDIRFTWMHHPVFGSPLIDGAVLDIDAEEIWADTQAPGDVLVHGAVDLWPTCLGRNGRRLDMSKLIERGDRREVFACLAKFRSPRARIRNEMIGLAVELNWDVSVFPFMWLWQELGRSPDYPWWGVARAVGLEPSSTPPESAPRGGDRSIGEVVLVPGASREAFVELAVEVL